MSKYVLNFSKYINKDTLLTDILPLIDNSISIDKFNDNIIEYLGIDESTLHNYTVNIQLSNHKKDIKSYLRTLKSKNSIYEIDTVKLNNLGLNDQNESFTVICKLLSKILGEVELLNELNSLNIFSKQKIGELLLKYRIIVDENILDIFTNLINKIYLDSLTENISGYNPIIRSNYFDVNNYFVSKIEMGKQSNIYSTITEFSGEIYDSLDFKTKEEAKKYQEKNHIKEELLDDVVSVLHFNCESNLSCWYNDLTILKYRTGCIYIDYGERLFVQNRENNTSITPEEIDSVIQEFKYREINNDFITYVIRELEEFKKTIIDRNQDYFTKMVPIVEQHLEANLLRNINLELAKSVLNDSSYGNGKTINVEMKVTSDKPILFIKNPTLTKN